VVPFEKEVLTPVQQVNEYIMTSLRTVEGLQPGRLSAQQQEELVANSRKYIDSGLMKWKDDALVLTREGKLLADGIAAALFF
jgi:oxygen-independent coproporphyrinogen-3 oxidase